MPKEKLTLYLEPEQIEWLFSIMNGDFKKKKRTKRKRIYNI